MQQNMVKFLGFTTVSFLFLGAGLQGVAYADSPTSKNIVVTENQIAQLEAQLKDLGSKNQAFTVASMQVSNEYTALLAEQLQLEVDIEVTKNKIAENGETQAVIEQQMGTLVGEFYRSAGQFGSIVEVFAQGTNALHGGVLAEKLNNSHDKQLQEVVSQQQDNKALLEKLESQKSRKVEVTSNAEIVLLDAKQLAEELKNQENSLVTDREQLMGKLAVLRETSVEEEKQRQAKIEEEERQTQLAAQIQASIAREAERVQEDVPPSYEEATAPPSYEEVTAPPVTQAPPSYEEVTAPPVTQAPPVVSVPPASSGYVEQAINYARAQIGKPYVYGAAGPGGFDCSGLVMQAFSSAGRNLPRVSGAQYLAGVNISLDQAQRGDLIFWSYANGASNFHVAIYLGEGRIIHAPVPGQAIIETDLFTIPGANMFAARV